MEAGTGRRGSCETARMDPLTPLEAVRVTSGPFHDLGGRFMASRSTFGRGAEWGWPPGLSFYVAGRGGVLGDVDGAVVAAAFGWFNPAVVRSNWEAGIAVAGARGAARRYNEAAALWGRDRLTTMDGIDRLAELAERLVAAADATARPLFAGWRAEPRVEDGPGHAGQIIHVLREWRGANHLIATTAVGLSPLEAILARDGEGQARTCGWEEPFPDCSALRGARGEAEAMTDRLCAPAFEQGLTGLERAELAALASAAHAAVTGGRGA